VYIGINRATGGMAIKAMFERKRDSRPGPRPKTMAKAAMMEITVETPTATTVTNRLFLIQSSIGQLWITVLKFANVTWVGNPVGSNVYDFDDFSAVDNMNHTGYSEMIDIPISSS
jgi:hypothetical protein